MSPPTAIVVRPPSVMRIEDTSWFVRGSISATVPLLDVAHTMPFPVARNSGRLGTRIVRTTSFERGSIRDTPPFAPSGGSAVATHTEPKPTATPCGNPSSGISATISFVAGSIRRTTPRSGCVTQMPPRPAATHAASSVSMSRLSRFVRVLIRATLPDRVATHTAPSLTVIPHGRSLPSSSPAPMRPMTSPEAGSILMTRRPSRTTQTPRAPTATAFGKPSTVISSVRSWGARLGDDRLVGLARLDEARIAGGRRGRLLAVLVAEREDDARKRAEAGQETPTTAARAAAVWRLTCRRLGSRRPGAILVR